MTSDEFQRLAAAFLAIAAFAPSAMAKPEIVLLRTKATFSAQSPESHWSVPIKSSDGGTVYILSLEPDFDTRHHVVTLELVLRHPGENSTSANLLDPTGKRHGLQAYDFAAADLAQGADKSAFGEKRVLSPKNLSLTLQVTISRTTVKPTSEAAYEIERLDLQIDISPSKA